MIRQILPSLLAGAGVTLQVFALTLLLSLPLACLLQAFQQFSGRLLKPLYRGYITLMRGTPLLLQLMFIFFECLPGSDVQSGSLYSDRLYPEPRRTLLRSCVGRWARWIRAGGSREDAWLFPPHDLLSDSAAAGAAQCHAGDWQ
ncbi:MAG: ABC transporter permease subunit [Holdemania massiliensis]